MPIRLEILALSVLCFGSSVWAQESSISQSKQRSHVERFSTPEMRAEQTESETTAKLAADPKDAESFNSRALARLRLGKYAEAEADLNRAIALGPNVSEYQANLGYVLWKLGKPEDAIRAERGALKLDEKNFTAHYQLGRFLLRAGNEKQVSEALAHLRTALEIDPRQYEVRFELIAAYRSLNDLANAAAQLDLLQDARPSDSRIDYIRALLSADRGEMKNAVENFQAALRKDENLLGTWQDLGLAYIKLKKWREAADAFAELAKRQPESAETVYLYALSLYNAGDKSAAEAAARRALRLNAGAEEAHTLLGIILAARGDAAAEAVESLTQAVALNPASFDANFYLGRAQYTAKDYVAAIKSLRQAVALNPNQAEARFFLGTVLEITGDSAEALKQYEQLVKLEPESVFGQIGLGALLVKQGEIDEAIVILRKAVALKMNNYESHWALGRALMLKEQYEAAVESFKRAIAVAPERAEAHYQLGLALRRLGRNEEAAKELQTAEKLNKDFRNSAIKP